MTTFRGYPACTCLAKWLPVYEAELQRRGILKGKLRIYQLIGGAPQSGGTHSKGGAFDLLDLPGALDVAIAREMGADATWSRPYNWDNRKGMAHIHGVLTGCPHNGPARYQIDAVRNGLNGLANHARDTGPRPLSGRTWEQGIAWAKAKQKPQSVIRPMTFNFPDVDKLPNDAARVKAAVALIRDARPTLVGFNELVGITASGGASALAHEVDQAMSADWQWVKPTLRLNENYVMYDADLLKVVHQYGDSILEASTGRRHITRTVFKVRKTGALFAHGQTHLVNGTTGAHKRHRQSQAADALASMHAVSVKHDDCPFIIQGDFNTPDPLAALVKAGMKNTRLYADTSTTRDAATYTNKDKAKPSTNRAWIIDGQYVSDDVYVLGYNVVRDLERNGNYHQPRASDHDPTISALRF